MSSKIWLHTRWTDLTHPAAAIEAVSGSDVPSTESDEGTPVLEIISEAECWGHLRASDRGVLSAGRRGEPTQITFSVIGGGLLACIDEADGQLPIGQQVTVETSGPVNECGRWVVRATGTAQEPHPSVVGRTSFRRMDDLGGAGYTFLYVPTDRIRGFCQM